MTRFTRAAWVLAVCVALVGAARAQFGFAASRPNDRLGATPVAVWMQFANAAFGPSQGNLPEVRAAWTGACRDGALEGRGTLTVSPVYGGMGSNGIAFTGTFVHGRAEGPAEVVFDAGVASTFSGMFRDSQPNGHGVLVTAGMRIEGDYVYGKLWNGKVVVDYADSSHGEFSIADGWRAGRSTLRFADGATYEDTADGSLQRTVYADGGTLVSEFSSRQGYHATYCTGAGRRIWGDYVPAAQEPYQAPPQMGALSRRLREEGETEISFVIDTDGSKKNVALHKSSGAERLDAVAMSAVANWPYRPATVAGRPVTTYAVVAIGFSLVPPALDVQDAPVTIPAPDPNDHPKPWRPQRCRAHAP